MLKDTGKIHRLDINDAQKPTTDSPKRKLVMPSMNNVQQL